MECGYSLNAKEEFDHLELSEYVTLVVSVPQTHADKVRDAMGDAGAGLFGDYSHCSFSVIGTGRSRLHKGEEVLFEEEVEERIETICPIDLLDPVLSAIRKAHPHEETVIDIFPVYAIAKKKETLPVTVQIPPLSSKQ